VTRFSLVNDGDSTGNVRFEKSIPDDAKIMSAVLDSTKAALTEEINSIQQSIRDFNAEYIAKGDRQ
jgi:hypothetical protein